MCLKEAEHCCGETCLDAAQNFQMMIHLLHAGWTSKHQYDRLKLVKQIIKLPEPIFEQKLIKKYIKIEYRLHEDQIDLQDLYGKYLKSIKTVIHCGRKDCNILHIKLYGDYYTTFTKIKDRLKFIPNKFIQLFAKKKNSKKWKIIYDDNAIIKDYIQNKSLLFRVKYKILYFTQLYQVFKSSSGVQFQNF